MMSTKEVRSFGARPWVSDAVMSVSTAATASSLLGEPARGERWHQGTGGERATARREGEGKGERENRVSCGYLSTSFHSILHWALRAQDSANHPPHPPRTSPRVCLHGVSERAIRYVQKSSTCLSHNVSYCHCPKPAMHTLHTPTILLLPCSMSLWYSRRYPIIFPSTILLL